MKISSSKSSSEANTTTQNYDQRIAAGNNSTNVSANNSTVSVLDAGAINQSFGFSKSVYNSAMQGLTMSVASIKDAYSEAKAGEQKVLVAGGLMILGVVALAAVRGKQ
jgi:hypothetical protein